MIKKYILTSIVWISIFFILSLWDNLMYHDPIILLIWFAPIIIPLLVMIVGILFFVLVYFMILSIEHLSSSNIQEKLKEIKK